MSITDRMENDGMSFQDANMKESLVAGAREAKLGERFSFAIAAAELPEGTVGMLFRVQPFAHINGGYVRAADYVALERRFAEHLEAWKANNANHAKRIEELERGLRDALLRIDRDKFETGDLRKLLP